MGRTCRLLYRINNAEECILFSGGKIRAKSSLKIFGQDIYYLPRETISKDNILGEDRASKFDDAYMIEAYIEGTDGFEGQGDLYSKFGLEVRDEVNFVVSRKIWDRFVGLQDEINDSPRPREGYLIL